MTFSIAARCARTRMFGVALSSSSPAVAARCAFVRAGVGAALSQNVTDPSLGTQMLDLMATGQSAQEAIAAITAHTPDIAYRQLLAIGARGSGVAFSGDRALGIHAAAMGCDAVAGGNMLATRDLPAAMIAGFEQAQGDLGDRLIAALTAAVQAGGEEGPVHSAGLLIADDVPWPIASLRIDWTQDDPVAELASLWTLYAPHMADYVNRALNPAASPSYGVPGDP